MKILQIINKSETTHIRFESGQQGKINMMLKITRFLTKDLKSRKIKIQKEAEAISDMREVKFMWDNMQVEISDINFRISKINNVVKIEDFNNFENITITEYEVY